MYGVYVLLLDATTDEVTSDVFILQSTQNGCIENVLPDQYRIAAAELNFVPSPVGMPFHVTAETQTLSPVYTTTTVARKDAVHSKSVCYLLIYITIYSFNECTSKYK